MVITAQILGESIVKRESRIGKITSKRQLTIPKDFYNKLHLGAEVEIILENDEIKIKKLKKIEENFDNYSDLVLQSILEEGITDKEEILKEFRLRMNLMPHAVQKLLSDVREQVTEDSRTSDELDKELFGDE